MLPTNDTWKIHRKLIQPAFGPSHLKNSAYISNDTMKLMDIKLGKDYDALDKKSLKLDLHGLMCAISLDIMFEYLI
jgi:cytochrome P450